MAYSSNLETRPISLQQATYGFVLAGMVMAAVGFLTFARSQRSADNLAALDLALHVRLEGAALDLSRNIQDDWERLRSLASVSAPTDVIQGRLESAFGTDRQVAWVAAIDADNTVVASTVGPQWPVTTLPWIGSARNAPAVGALSAATVAESALVLAQPFGEAGVLAAVLPYTSLSTHLKETTEVLSLDLFLIGPSGSMIGATEDFQGPLPDVPSLRNAVAGIESSQSEIWPDGRQYFTSSTSLAVKGMPEAQLRLVGRIDPGEFIDFETGQNSALLRLVVVLVLIIGAITVGFVRVFIVPFGLLARNADRIASGADDYPHEGHSTLELALLSSALVRLRASRALSRML
jgi:hypothetical protein